MLGGQWLHAYRIFGGLGGQDLKRGYELLGNRMVRIWLRIFGYQSIEVMLCAPQSLGLGLAVSACFACNGGW